MNREEWIKSAPSLQKSLDEILPEVAAMLPGVAAMSDIEKVAALPNVICVYHEVWRKNRNGALKHVRPDGEPGPNLGRHFESCLPPEGELSNSEAIIAANEYSQIWLRWEASRQTVEDYCHAARRIARKLDPPINCKPLSNLAHGLDKDTSPEDGFGKISAAWDTAVELKETVQACGVAPEVNWVSRQEAADATGLSLSDISKVAGKMNGIVAESPDRASKISLGSAVEFAMNKRRKERDREKGAEEAARDAQRADEELNRPENGNGRK